MRVFESSSPFSRIVASMVHESARHDPIRAAIHASFIATRLIGGMAAAVVLPVYLALWGAPDLVAVACFAWLTAPLAVALYLSRTGRLATAHLMSASTLSGLVVFASAWTGGPTSLFLPWLIAVPAEAVLSGSARTVVAATAIAAAALLALVGLDAAALLPAALAFPVPAWSFALLGALPALLYAGLLAARGGAMARAFAEHQRAGGDQLRTIVDAAGDVLLTLRRNGNVTYSSDAALALLGTDGAGLDGDGLFARVHVADRPNYLTALDDAAAGRQSDVEFRVQRGRPDGAQDYVWVEMRCRPMPGEAGATPDIVGVLREVNERKWAELALSEAREEAESANIAKGRFLANMSHELRTPLNAIIGFSEILTSELYGRMDNEKHREYAGLIHESGNHLLEVVNDILDMSKIETGNFEIHPEPFDVAELIDGCRKMVVGDAEAARLRIETDLPYSMLELCADRRACKQVVLNLLSNAVKFSRPGGRIVVGSYRDGEGVAIYVADEGIGIPRHEIARLGDPFVQLREAFDRRHAGTGLGLSVVKGLVVLHGGKVEIESELGLGTRVTVRLPRSALAQVSANGTRRPDAQPETSPNAAGAIKLSA
ncbi:sensor histidine kinase [Microbaculum marinisediminis]|uniref:histidine kinase n=1 Tax=Microbaculum marinisediminis TaxID=2931392 RepID=A0AAW5QUS0_9HYPH|nr:PAS domain-containing sensor histidine kinase [Microbaculum sp. A6E488]MCT8971244.1 PAS domain-containing sensor histidine kinase [Microbaculum sp. A6E488]